MYFNPPNPNPKVRALVPYQWPSQCLNKSILYIYIPITLSHSKAVLIFIDYNLSTLWLWHKAMLGPLNFILILEKQILKCSEKLTKSIFFFFLETKK